MVATADASNTATRIALANALRAAYEAHRIKTAGGVHGSADATNAITVPIAVDDTGAVLLAIELKTKYNLHRVVTLSSVHGLADSTNAVTSAAPAAGIFNTGDVVRVKAIGPKWTSDDIADAGTALKASDQNFGTIVIAGPVSKAEADVVSAMLDDLASRGKRPYCLFAARDMNEGESEQTWLDAVKADYAAYTDDRVTVCATPSRCTVDDGIRVRIFDTNALHAVCARLVGFELVSQGIGDVGLGALEGVAITDSSGTLLSTAHDEGGDIQGLDGAHFLTLYRLPDPTRAKGVYIVWPWVMYEVGVDRIQTGMTRRVANKAERIAASVGFGQLGSAKTYVAGSLPGTGVLSVPASKILESLMSAPLRSEGGLKREISDPDATDLVVVDRNVTVDGEKITVPVTISFTPKKYVGRVAITLNIKI